MVYSEPELVLPALEKMKAVGDKGISTSQILEYLRRRLRPTGIDAELLEGRNDDHFSQKVRNLKSHDTLEKLGFAEYRNRRFFITAAGIEFVDKFIGAEVALKNQGFSEAQKKATFTGSLKDVFIEEGHLSTVSKTVRARSAVLRRRAKEHYADDNGRLRCSGCGFESSEVFGEGAEGIIEIHHLEPLFLTDGTGFRARISDMLSKVVPLCPNCHRFVHKNKDAVVSIPELRGITGYVPD